VSAPRPVPVPGGGQEEVDARVAVVGVGLLVCLREPDHLAVELDGEHEGVLLRARHVADVLLRDAEPPVRDLGLGGDAAEPLGVRGLQRAERDALADEAPVSHVVRSCRERALRPSRPCARRRPG
jgi:hypothetical protein